MPETVIRVGTRGSPLALAQTRAFLRLLATIAEAGLGQEVIIATTGDVVQDRPLADIGGKGLFAKEIHEALLDRRIDFAAHSLKDLETTLPPGDGAPFSVPSSASIALAVVVTTVGAVRGSSWLQTTTGCVTVLVKPSLSVTVKETW